MLRDTAINWVRENCCSDKFVAGFIRTLDESLATGVNCSFVVGANLMVGGAPYLIHWFARELFMFQLSLGQAAKLGTAHPNAMRFSKGTAPIDDGLRPADSFSLDRLELVQPVLRDRTHAIGIRCAYHLVGNPPPKYGVRMDYSSGEQTHTETVEPLNPPVPVGTTTLKFSPPSLPDRGADHVMAAFVRFCAASESKPMRSWPIVSNCLAALIEIGG
jgi:hypothetical protein